MVEGRLEKLDLVIQKTRENKWLSASFKNGEIVIQGHSYSVSTDHVEYLSEDDAKKCPKATARSKLHIIRTWLQGDRKMTIRRHWQLQLPCPVYCLLLGSNHHTKLGPTFPTISVALVLIPSRLCPGSFERVGIAHQDFYNVFDGAPEREVKLV